MANVTSGVFPCYENQFAIGASEESTNTIADMETFSVSFDDGVEEWKPYEAGGWTNRLKTAKSITISVSASVILATQAMILLQARLFLMVQIVMLCLNGLSLTAQLLSLMSLSMLPLLEQAIAQQ